MFHHVQRGVERNKLFRGRVELFAANVFGGVNDLALQVAGVHHVEVHEAERAHTGRGKIKGQRRTEAAGANAKHARSLQALLPFHADLGQDQVARIARELIGGELRQGNRIGDRSHEFILATLSRDPPAMEGMIERVSVAATAVASFWGR